MQLSLLLLATSALAVVSGQLYAREASPELEEYLEAREAFLEARDTYIESSMLKRQTNQTPKPKKPKQKPCPPGTTRIGHYTNCYRIGGPMPKSAPMPKAPSGGTSEPIEGA